MENAVRAATRLEIFILASDIDTAAEQLESVLKEVSDEGRRRVRLKVVTSGNSV
jgi:hypothetical protein